MNNKRIDKGHYILKLDDVMKSKKISINKIKNDLDTDFYTIKRVMNGETSRFDIYVLARICTYLHCELSDIIEYVPDEKGEEQEKTTK